MNETPRGNRTHIAFFGLRNAGKSTLANAFAGQDLSIVSAVAGTTTDPVSKAMEILPLGPCLVTDTAGLDDEGDLGQMRVEKTLKVLETTDIAVWVTAQTKSEEPKRIEPELTQTKSEEPKRIEPELTQTKSEEPKANEDAVRAEFVRRCSALHIPFLEFHRGDSVDDLKRRIAGVRLAERAPGLLEGLVERGDRVLCVVPIDESAPKDRLILPQQQVIRNCLDLHAVCSVCQPEELSDVLKTLAADAGARVLVVTDSQAFGTVSRTVDDFRASVAAAAVRLTSFSILFARQKGDLTEYARGLKALRELKDGATVLVAEGCTHHRQCNDIGSVKIPKALRKLTGKDLKFAFASGNGFPETNASLVVQCGGCMLTRREVLRRIGLARAAGVPIVNYGMVLAAANGLRMENVLA